MAQQDRHAQVPLEKAPITLGLPLLWENAARANRPWASPRWSLLRSAEAGTTSLDAVGRRSTAVLPVTRVRPGPRQRSYLSPHPALLQPRKKREKTGLRQVLGPKGSCTQTNIWKTQLPQWPKTPLELVYVCCE